MVTAPGTHLLPVYKIIVEQMEMQTAALSTLCTSQQSSVKRRRMKQKHKTAQ